MDEAALFAATAAVIINGGKMEEVGEKVESLVRVPLGANNRQNSITGSIIFIDSYGNLISNITRDVFMRIFSKKEYLIAIRSNSNSIDHISTSYNSEGISELVALFNSLDLLEIGINGSNASELLNLHTGDAVRIASPGSNSKPGTLF
ncbi:MAG: SAM hydroxide adenosyltransferase [Bacteroidales bacterium]